MYLGNHSVSLGTDPALASHNPAIFSTPSNPGTEKLNKSPRKIKKTPNNSNIFQIFYNNTCTEPRNTS